jgi:hypothetical protein
LSERQIQPGDLIKPLSLYLGLPLLYLAYRRFDGSFSANRRSGFLVVRGPPGIFGRWLALGLWKSTVTPLGALLATRVGPWSLIDSRWFRWGTGW